MAPKCRLCGEEHFGTCLEHMRRQARAETATVEEEISSNTETVDKHNVQFDKKAGSPEPPLTKAEKVKKWRKEHPEEYRAYMRDYMKERRKGK